MIPPQHEEDKVSSEIKRGTEAPSKGGGRKGWQQLERCRNGEQLSPRKQVDVSSGRGLPAGQSRLATAPMVWRRCTAGLFIFLHSSIPSPVAQTAPASCRSSAVYSVGKLRAALLHQVSGERSGQHGAPQYLRSWGCKLRADLHPRTCRHVVPARQSLAALGVPLAGRTQLPLLQDAAAALPLPLL